MSLQEEKIRKEGGCETGSFRVFKCGTQNPRIPQLTSRGFLNNEAASAKERRLKLPEGSVHLLSVLLAF